MLRMSKMTDYGTVVLAYLARAPQKVHAAADVATHTRLAPPTVSKLLKSLSKAELVRSFRGARGGYALSRPAEAITAAEIIDALEGPIAITECSGDHSLCTLESVCALSSRWQRINHAIRIALDEITLAQLMGPGPAPRMDFGHALAESGH